MKLFLAATLLLHISCLCVSAELSISRAFYRDSNASLHLFLVNQGAESVSLMPPVVNGTDCSSLGRDGANVGDVLWYRCRPNPISPGEIADLTITLAAPTDKPVTVELAGSSGDRLRRTIRCGPEHVRFQAVRFSADLRTVDVYVRCDDLALRRIRMDGKDVRRLCRPWPAESFNGIAFTRMALTEPLAANSFHVFDVETQDGSSTACQVRAIPAEFLIGVYGVPSAPNLADWVAHGIDHHLSFGAVNADTLDLCAEQDVSVGSKYIAEPLVNRDSGNVPIFDEEVARASFAAASGKPSLLYHHLVDEPDVADYYAGRKLGATAMELASRAEFCEVTDPGRYTFVQLDNTFRPDNYRVYGESADVLATHRYSLGNYLRSEAGESSVKRLPFLEDMVETLDRFRAATEPRPFFVVPQFFNLGPARSGRAPTIEEMRLQCYLMIARGASGVIHYIHSGSTGGGEGARTPALWDAMTGLHAELKRVGGFIASGTPSPPESVTCDSPNVLASGLLCGDRMALVLINLSHRSALDRFTVIPNRGIGIRIAVPPWMDASALEVVPAEGGAPLVVARDRVGLSFTVEEVAVARCLFVRSRE